MSVMPAPDQRQNGMALLTILLIIAVLTALVTRLGLSNHIWLKQVENGAELAQARQSTRAVQTWVRGILEDDSNPYDAYTDSWAQSVPALPIAWGSAQGWIEDMNARFNVNNLVDAQGRVNSAALEKFERLLLALELDKGIAEAVVDWLDKDGEIRGFRGAEDGYYLGRTPAYLPANRKIDDIAELKLVRGISAEVWRVLQAHVTALPGETDINVNTATAPVLVAMLSHWGPPRNALGRAQTWLQSARSKPAHDLKTFSKQLGGDENNLPDGIGVSTEYFMANIILSFDELEYRTANLYHRSDNRADLLWQLRRYN